MKLYMDYGMNSEKDSLFTFFESDEEKPSDDLDKSVNHASLNDWKILIVDDDDEVHKLTKIVLRDYQFEERAVQIYSAYSGIEAIEFMSEQQDIALVLLDVVMETDNAGLECARNIREKLHNDMVRIILRTGQPGQAPEEEVIKNYDINDYKSKTELTVQSLFTAITSALRTYQYIKTIDANKQGLESIISATRAILELDTFSRFHQQVFDNMCSFNAPPDKAIYLVNPAGNEQPNVSKTRSLENFKVLAAKGYELDIEGACAVNLSDETTKEKLQQALDQQSCVIDDRTFIGFMKASKGGESLSCMQWDKDIGASEQKLLAIFYNNVSVVFENVSLNEEIKETQKEMIYTLSELVEGRSKETASHIRRVAGVSAMLARKVGLNEQQVNMIELTAPMHDIGKIGTPDSILKKPGKLTDAEYNVMQDHAAYGAAIFGRSSREVMLTSALIAAQHHEKWDGSGYPNGLTGEDIHIYGRIVALADVVDALVHKRCYKQAWEMPKVLETLQKERGKHFDPQLVDIFLSSQEEYQQLLKLYPL